MKFTIIINAKNKFQFVVNFTKGSNDNDFSGFTFLKKVL